MRYHYSRAAPSSPRLPVLSSPTPVMPAPWNNDPLPAHHQHINEKWTTIPVPSLSKQTRSTATTHLSVDAPICIECLALENTFFDPNCKGCKSSLLCEDSKISHVFAVMRQWVPQVQQCIEFLINEAVRRGAHPDDRDSLTDMTLLMYACKAGANGVGDAQSAARVAKLLIDMGADLTLRCKWTQMTALHYAAYFDVAPVITHLLMKSKGTDVDSPCVEHENGTALHIATGNLSAEAIRVLLQFGADPDLKDDLARKPIDCLPEAEDFSLIPDTPDLMEKIEKLLSKGFERGASPEEKSPPNSVKPSAGSISRNKIEKVVSGKTVLTALGLKVGDRVLVGGTKLGTLRYCGTTDFSAGVWAGVALDSPDGKNDGSVKGVMYFKCQKNHGVFVLANKIAKPVNHGKVPIAHVKPRLTECLSVIEEKHGIRVGDRVNVKDLQTAPGVPEECKGTIKFIGEVEFMHDENRWIGVELDEPLGRHNGTVQGVEYFKAPLNTGVFVTDAKLTKIYNDPLRKLSVENEQNDANSPTEASENRSENGDSPDGSIHKTYLRKSQQLQNNTTNAKTVQVMGSSLSSPSASAISEGSSGRSARLRSEERPFNRKKEAGWQTVNVLEFTKFKKQCPKKYLAIGMSAICTHSKASYKMTKNHWNQGTQRRQKLAFTVSMGIRQLEMGVVKFVGRVDFAPGIWAGLELRNPVGKHDGVIEGRRYFQTKPHHGVMIRPKKISIHGISGEDLLKPEHEYPF
ncbi:hypothetical protein TCAL_11612 [Tigriopus californicus]|uniref:CAP-Gly domain-containing protein n=1 Tax=Tigriopus californicus TaxID=6832 RepID=A0A553PBB5_TIGCA|nr:hypothetical protein TCAL_11612 [Tigriopus californicus]